MTTNTSPPALLGFQEPLRTNGAQNSIAVSAHDHSFKAGAATLEKIVRQAEVGQLAVSSSTRWGPLVV